MPRDTSTLIDDSLQLGLERAQKLMLVDARVAFAPSAGVLIAEGDSWLDYPVFQDIAEALETEHGFRVHSAAHFGDTAESMAYETKQLDRTRRLFKDLADRGEPHLVPKGIVLSCGGNDIVDVLGVLLNHRNSGLGVLNEDVVRGLFDVRLKAAIASLVGSMLAFSAQYFPGQRIPIVIHGYGYAVPDGRGYPLGFVGPWLKPAFARRGHVTDEPENPDELARNAAIIQTLIDRLNDRVLAEIAARPSLVGKLTYVDLRTVFKSSTQDQAYLESWRDEMHATVSAFREAATLIAKALK